MAPQVPPTEPKAANGPFSNQRTTDQRVAEGAAERTRAFIQPGERAPDFLLNATPDQKVGPSDFRGRNLVLVFYPADWSPVCTDEVVLYNEVFPELRHHNCEVLGISVDGTWCHMAFAKDRHLRFPLLADFEPKGQVSRAYGAYRHTDGVSERALVLINGEGIVHWSYLSPLGVNPGVDGVIAALEDLTGKATADARQPRQEAQAAAVPGRTAQHGQQSRGEVRRGEPQQHATATTPHTPTQKEHVTEPRHGHDHPNNPPATQPSRQ